MLMVVLGATTFLLAVPPAGGDGGLVRLSAPLGPFTVTVFTAPTPLRVGPIDVSVLVQRQSDGDAVLDADVGVTLRSLTDPGLRRAAPATHAMASNRLLYATPLDVSAPGRWAIDVALHDGEEAGTVTVEVEVDTAPPPALAFWPYLALPAVAVALFALRERLRARDRSRSAAG